MYLKSIEIKGFKSFADKAQIDLARGVTAIVGPNGCGKSNVVDAVRWVLGESSARALRGMEMSDVIFNGAKTRAALGMAETRLTFSDCEDTLESGLHEVSVARRLFRDGKSHFLICDKRCRRKDITELFMNTGAGQMAYSIFEQGKIDLILSAKPEDRRSILEEAASISKYKIRRKDSMRKLEQSQDNIARLSDILLELERQNAKLKRQAAKAAKYKDLRERLTVLDKANSLRELEATSRKREKASKKLEKLRTLKNEQETKHDELERELTTLNGEIENIESRVEELQRSHAEREKHLKSATDHIAFNLSVAEDAEQRQARQEEQCQSLREQLRRIEEELALVTRKTPKAIIRDNSSKDTREQLKQEKAKTLEKLQEQITESKRILSESKVLADKKRREVDENTHKLASLNARIESLASNVEDLHTRASKAKPDLVQSRAKDLAGKILAEEELLQNLLTEDEKARQKSADAKERHDKIDTEIDELENKIQSHKNELSKLNAKNEYLEKQIDQSLQSSRGVEADKVLLANALNSQAKSPAEIITAMRGREKAVHVALKDYLNTILLANNAQLAEFLAALAAKNARENIVVASLDSIKNTQSSRKQERDASLLINFVSYPNKEDEQKYSSALQALLQDFYLAENIDEALLLHVKMPNATFACLDGSLLDRHGIIHFPKKNNSENSPLKLKNDLEKSRQTADAKNVNIEKLFKVHKRLIQRREKAKFVFESQLKKSQELSVTLSGLRERLKNLRAETLRVKEEKKREALELQNLLNKYEREQIDLKQAKNESEKCATLLQNEERTLHAKIFKLEKQIEELQTSKENLREQIDKLEREIALDKEKSRAQNLATQATEREMQTLQNQRIDFERQIKHYAEDAANEAKKAANARKTSEKLGREAENYSSEVKNVAKLLISTRQKREKLREQAAQKNTHAHKLNNLIRANVNEIGKAEIKFTQNEIKIEQICERVNENYQIDLRQSRLENLPLHEVCLRSGLEHWPENIADIDEEDWQKLAVTLKELRASFSRLGDVNLAAIDEYDKEKQREDFLREQLNDLEHAREDLLKSIQKLDDVAREKFLKTFAEIRKNFQTIFAKFFSEGAKSDLTLLDEDNPLECGVKILAQPPGKKLQKISLLSGGERSMTAVALLLAIYKVRPAPFCILDELDAPLDDANVNRFVRAIDSFADDGQFVIITHNKRTMRRADIIYGITMQERGVSKLASVRFEKNVDLPFAQRGEIQSEALQTYKTKNRRSTKLAI